ncbi:MAG TPA: peptide ABC transporter substrate-binding protein [Candidatus Acidoferrales bacterium]|nr:peptide ABC transporter substrate-binding protein [Candidatus Acidoferrales bacterium]
MRALIVSAFLLLTACTRVGTGASGSGNPWTEPGVLRIADLQEPDTLNPVVGNAQIDVDLSMFWAGYLFNWSDRNALVPELATQVPSLRNGGISADGKTITYHLRRGVLWQDGRPFSADDVIFTWHAVMNPQNDVASRLGYDDIVSIDRRDAYTITIHLKQPYAPFVNSFFTMSSTAYPVLPAHLLAALPNINQASFNQQPIGTGPFIVQRWQRGQAIIFRANPHYWRGAPGLREISYLIVPDENTTANLFRAHEIDFDMEAPSALYDQFRAIPGIRTQLVPFTQYDLYSINMSNPILRDVRVRKALAYGLNDEMLLQKVSHGIDIPGTTDQPDYLWAHNPNTVTYPYSPERARSLLAQAGWLPGPDGIRQRGGKRLSLVIAGLTGSLIGTQMDTLAQSQWRAIGIDAQIKDYPTPLFFASYGAGGILQSGRFDLGSYAWVNGIDPDDSTLWMCNQFPPAGQNVSHFCDPQVDRAERIALTSYDQAVRKRAYDIIQARLADEEPMILLFYGRRIVVENTDLQNFRPAHAVTEFWNSWEWRI